MPSTKGESWIRQKDGESEWKRVQEGRKKLKTERKRKKQGKRRPSQRTVKRQLKKGNLTEYFYTCTYTHSTHSHRFQVSLPTSRTLSHKSSFISRACNLWNVLPSSCFPESYNLPSFKSKINELDLISLPS